ncbi:MAG: DinB family protein [Chloroflexi bacterium]|nr:DinB family protein [Chloroflexota bacterium]
MAHDEIDGLLARLADAPARIAAAVAGRTEAELTAPPDGDDWSALGVLAHIRASDDILSTRLIAMVVREEPSLSAFDERRWGAVMAYEDADFATLLAAYTGRRAEVVRALRRLTPRDWRRVGIHETRGLITLLDTLRHLVEHEAEHCLQLETLLA